MSPVSDRLSVAGYDAFGSVSDPDARRRGGSVRASTSLVEIYRDDEILVSSAQYRAASAHCSRQLVGLDGSSDLCPRWTRRCGTACERRCADPGPSVEWSFVLGIS